MASPITITRSNRFVHRISDIVAYLERRLVRGGLHVHAHVHVWAAICTRLLAQGVGDSAGHAWGGEGGSSVVSDIRLGAREGRGRDLFFAKVVFIENQPERHRPPLLFRVAKPKDSLLNYNMVYRRFESISTAYSLRTFLCPEISYTGCCASSEIASSASASVRPT